jgi:hypothetical protein
MNLTSREKKLFIVLALVLCGWWMLGCGSESPTPSVATVPVAVIPEVDISYLTNLYAEDNERYFQNRLPKDPSIVILDKKDRNMATSSCQEDGCVLEFNIRYTAAFRVAAFTMLHEQCHIKTGTQEKQINPTTGKPFVHGKVWRTCMLQLDAQGAFREIIIDNDTESM